MEIRKRRYLEFEKPLADLDSQIAQLKSLKLQSGVDVSGEIRALETKSQELLSSLFQHLEPYQVVQLSRHPDRPTFLDYIEAIADDFIVLSGDRSFREDPALVGGIAEIAGESCMVLGHQKGKSTADNQIRNFGMPRPEGYRKALRLMEMAERYQLPLITFIDTPGAYPGIEAEERGQAESIAECILRMTDLNVPILSVVLGEGGSGGALAIAVADRLLMLEFTTYSVISPEGCAAITWKDAAFASKAAENLKLTAPEILKLGVADEIIGEPLGGVHRDPLEGARRLKEALVKHRQQLVGIDPKKLLQERYDRYRRLGAFSA
jgi:acetyl-CoA carboxylase carboxyl transferase subunit alpha